MPCPRAVLDGVQRSPLALPSPTAPSSSVLERLGSFPLRCSSALMGSFIPPGQHSLPATGLPPAAFRSLLCRPREHERDTKKRNLYTALPLSWRVLRLEPVCVGWPVFPCVLLLLILHPSFPQQPQCAGMSPCIPSGPSLQMPLRQASCIRLDHWCNYPHPVSSVAA